MCVRIKWVVLWSLWAARFVRQPGPVVDIRQGAVRGQISVDGSHYQYFGIPYASSQKQYRFQAPGPAPAWDGVREAIDEHIRCPQLFGDAQVGQEDCLILNVYTPLHTQDGDPLPVMVFIHVGGFKEGSSSRMLYGPDFLVARGVILVTFNYRLGVPGFLCLGIKEAPGNAGMKDQVAALKWIQQNIKSFGGDPDNVTIFGESAGGVSVSYHLVSPLSRGLFHKAIIQSGSSTSSWARQSQPLITATALAKTLGHNAKDLRQLYEMFMKEDLSKLVTAEIPARKGQLKYMHLPYTPCVEPYIDGVEHFITDTSHNIFSSGNYNKVPVIIGSNSQEGYFFAAFEDDESLNSIQYEKTLPTDLVFPTKSEQQAAALQVKQLYLGEDEISWENLLKFSKLHGEPFFNYPVLAETELLLETSGQPVFSYVFEHSGWRNFPKLISGPRFWMAQGASHADDLFYLFNILSLLPNLFETDMINKMTTLWTNFAKYGNPGDIDGISWPAAKHGSPVTLVLGSQPRVTPLLDALGSQRMQFWRTLYSKYRIRVNATHL